MAGIAGSSRAQVLADAMRLPLTFLQHSTWARRRGEPGIADFALGNPHEMPLPGLVDALQDWAAPLNKDWFAYTMSAQSAREAAAETLHASSGIPFHPDDIAMTAGGFAALAVGLKVLADPGEEVIISLPPWFFYRSLIAEAGLVTVPVPVEPSTFDLDIDALAAAITPRTRVVIVNTPNNPTGRIYPPETLRRLGSVLEDASRRYGRRIYLLSDEVYRRLVFDGRRPVSPAEYYQHTLVVYSYSKTLLAPGQRIGYLAAAPGIAERVALRERIAAVQIAQGWAFPNALLQHALPDLEQLSISLPHLQRKRDRLLAALRGLGYVAHTPEGAFFLLVQSPWADDAAFAEALADEGVLVLPGQTLELPGYFRLALTASNEMIERAIPGFAAAIAGAQVR